jgi:predicted Fe-Mo cluster-binding NifX family protein
MKVLIAAEGTSWESPVAQKFENAVWYLVIDTQTREKEVYQNLPPHDHNRILVMASQMHVSAIVAGWINSATARLMQSLNLRLVVGHKMKVRATVKKLNLPPASLRQAGEHSLEIADLADFRQGLVIPGVTRRELSLVGRKGPKYAGSAVSPASTPRGHHHLQQYGGRGH